MNTNNIPKLTVILGITLIIIAYLVPYNSMEILLGQGLRLLGLVSLFINPVLGIIGGIFSFRKKQWLYFVLNVAIILSFLVIISIGYSLQE